VERFLAYTNEFPWTWTPAMAEEFFSDLRSVKGPQAVDDPWLSERVAAVCFYVGKPDYGWDRVCERHFGTHPAQVLFEWNTGAHVQDNEQPPTKPAFSPSPSYRTSSITPMIWSRWLREPVKSSV
jgi:integrase/recombinase XerD